jgi:hypothetical protein
MKDGLDLVTSDFVYVRWLGDWKGIEALTRIGTGRLIKGTYFQHGVWGSRVDSARPTVARECCKVGVTAMDIEYRVEPVGGQFRVVDRG